MAPLTLPAQNPIIRGQFAADPTARVFNNKVYVYPSHDIPAPPGQRQDWFCMADYHVFSSENLTEWTDHGVILSQEQVPWGNPSAYSMWAPDCVYKNGRYYFFFPNAPKEGRGFSIGVATSSRPEGPFTPEASPIKGVSGIDPCVLLDDDGQAYLYWSGMGIRGSKLKDNLLELDGEMQEMKLPARDGASEGMTIRVGGQEMKGLPEGFKEGPFAFKRGSWYYLTFPWVRQENGTETLAYAMSKNPLGPWDFKGVIMSEHDNGCWTNHHSILEYRGQWYIFYHRNDYSPSMDKRRSARIERLTFNADGTIVEPRQTMRGVGVNQATEKIDVDRYTQASQDVTTTFVDTTNTFAGWQAQLPKKGSWIKYPDVDFSSIAPVNAAKAKGRQTLGDGYLIVCAKASEDTEFCIREKDAKGKVIARVKMKVKETRGTFQRDLSGRWLTLNAPLEYVPSGVTDLVVTCEGTGVDIDWVQFKNRPKYFSPTTGETSAPDENGFIRRWRLMEPIAQTIPSNVVFTDTWLRNLFTDASLKPGKKSKWHALDSENYNVKLFRFGELWCNHTYGSLFWAETQIVCSEDIPNVRLAAGSNGASMWWLNGEEALLLSGDRRMVVDDGMSPRLTLKKGVNTLRCALVNGPGLSDFCVRFLDEAGNPITNFQVRTQQP